MRSRDLPAPSDGLIGSIEEGGISWWMTTRIIRRRSARTIAGGADVARVAQRMHPWRSSRTATRARRRCGRNLPPRLQGADKLFLTDIYAASEKPIDGITGRCIVNAVTASGPGAPCLNRIWRCWWRDCSRKRMPGDIGADHGGGGHLQGGRSTSRKNSRRAARTS